MLPLSRAAPPLPPLRWSLGLYPGIIKAAMAVYDIPEAIAVVRNAVCAAPTPAAGFAGVVVGRWGARARGGC
jgi:hypothetical protein